jgi:hypothetical protein
VAHRAISFSLFVVIAMTMVEPAAAEEAHADGIYYGRQFLVGLLGTGAGFFGGGLLALAGNGDSNEYEMIGRFVLGGLVGTTVATAGGVHIVGSDENFRGSFGAAWTGALVGTVAGVAWLTATEHQDPAITVIGIAFPTLGAMYGFNATRHLRIQPTSVDGVRVSFVVGW